MGTEMNIDIKIFEAGHCVHMKKLALRTAPWQCCKFPALFALIRHPHLGNILFDTGYSEQFFLETKRFPFQLYRWLTPVKYNNNDSAISKLTNIGLSAKDINYIFISHFHADHIGAIKDFPNAKFIYSKLGYDHLKSLGRFSALISGFIEGLLPEDFKQRSLPIENYTKRSLPSELLPFKYGYRILGDDSLIAVELPGHARGQYGLLVRTQTNSYVFFVGDACWSSESYRSLTPPHWLSYFIMDNRQEYQTTLDKINQLYRNNSNIKIIPSHCNEILNSNLQSPLTVK